MWLDVLWCIVLITVPCLILYRTIIKCKSSIAIKKLQPIKTLEQNEPIYCSRLSGLVHKPNTLPQLFLFQTKTCSMKSTTESLLETQLCIVPHSLYFDTLPSEIIQTIIKYVCVGLEKVITYGEDLDTPTKKRVRLLTLSMLFSMVSPFRETISSMFTSIHLGHVSGVLYSLNNNKSFVIGHELFENAELELGLPKRILQHCGESVKTVSIFIDWKDLPPREKDKYLFVREFASLVGMYCPNVENLWFGRSVCVEPFPPFKAIVPALLSQYSPQLRSFEWQNYEYVPEFSMCSIIRDLTFPASPQLVSFLHSSGSSLVSLRLSIDDEEQWGPTIDAIEHNCPNLTKISFEYYQGVISVIGEERYTNFLCSFGSSLTHASVEGLSVGKLDLILRNCPNLSVDYYIIRDSSAEEWERVSKLGSMIKHLYIAALMCRDEKCVDAIAKCKNLQQLSICHLLAFNRAAEFGSELSSLSFLSSSSLIEFNHSYFATTQRNIAMLASATCNLRDLRLVLAKPIGDGIDFRSIAHSNLKLQSIYVSEEEKDDYRERKKGKALQILRMLVNAFDKCRSIDFSLLGIDEESISRDEIHYICGALPCRGVQVKIAIGSVEYQQGEVNSRYRN